MIVGCTRVFGGFRGRSRQLSGWLLSDWHARGCIIVLTKLLIRVVRFPRVDDRFLRPFLLLRRPARFPLSVGFFGDRSVAFATPLRGCSCRRVGTRSEGEASGFIKALTPHNPVHPLSYSNDGLQSALLRASSPFFSFGDPSTGWNRPLPQFSSTIWVPSSV